MIFHNNVSFELRISKLLIFRQWHKIALLKFSYLFEIFSLADLADLFFLFHYVFHRNLCHFDEGEIFVSNSTKI
ncbi:hypothetical protein RC62_4344 [Flavobacterium aquidurense]|uniref:Uncharacterized protein n=1 Tax=Flavobacterium aquidurense TaxID=362413 RepID=A0A0Q0RV60_9FLAO|nr:hypothetical protein RC62_4344 [Flavobacterium aquidurense]